MIEILGIPYKIVWHKDLNEINKASKEVNKLYLVPDEDDKGMCDGFTDYNKKEIHLYRGQIYNPAMRAQIIRHEITHAFLFEIGYTHYGDEDLVDKISKWVPQIERLYKKVEKM